MNNDYIDGLPSNRNFGFFLSILFFASSIYILVFYKFILIFLLLMVLSVLSVVVALYNPNYLQGLNENWFKIGQVLGRIVSPLVLGVIFFIVITPLAVVARLFGRDELRMNLSPSSTWWIDVKSKNNDIHAFKQQF